MIKVIHISSRNAYSGDQNCDNHMEGCSVSFEKANIPDMFYHFDEEKGTREVSFLMKNMKLLCLYLYRKMMEDGTGAIGDEEFICSC